MKLKSRSKNQLFRVLGRKGFEVVINVRDYIVYVTLYYLGKVIKGGGVEYTQVELLEMGAVNSLRKNLPELNINQIKLEQNYISYIYNCRDSVKGEIDVVAAELIELKRIEDKIKALKVSYVSCVEANTWYYSNDLGMLVSKEDINSEDLVGLICNNDKLSNRNSFIVKGGGGLIRYDFKDNCFYTTWDNNLTSLIEATNWYGEGYQDGYNDNFCVNSDTVLSKAPDFPNDEAKKSYKLGYTDGADLGYMDT